MPSILLIRHGENEYVKKGKLAGRLPGVHLNEKGVKQAEAVAKYLEEMPVKAVYSSPLARTMETAKPIAAVHKLKVVKRPGLIEMDYGGWEDKSLKQLRRRKLWKTVQNAPSRMRFPEGESFAEAQQRIATELETLVGMHKDRDLIVCVGHSDMIKLALAYYMGLALDNFQRIMVSPASISTVHLSANHSFIANVNQRVQLLDEKAQK
ncbi:MAG: phosphoglycerate mutase [Chloroflexi bacterium]|nr:MAG: phosphoglycerate mutase [Chloroflexota bacterium]MBL1196608.1 phosphoglycerate mutase [Chloroflexota bacterium]NOH13903.1 phosphoglycerate mutase [Chloroflexota bacterium]